MAPDLKYTKHHYGAESDLQVLGVWDVDAHNRSKVWVIYIHGGAWRDPRIIHETFAPTINAILSEDGSSAGLRDRIAGFASLDHRLSPHPEFPQDPASTPPKELRKARHPDHIDDVRSGIAFLQKEYGFSSNYVLVGHSAGACLAFQLVATPAAAGYMPEAIVGIAGVYDFTGISARSGGAYAGFLTAAFGDPAGWDEVAPMKFSHNFAEYWKGIAILASSKNDELVDEHEIDGMAAKLRKDGCRLVVYKDVRGSHHECWEKGTDIARLVADTFKKIQT
ncbi:Uu.00g066120.m01.CDS01 [Anthostomella pinea]|uniref:Kynurenine formamidase n=1 Tax=Anthostomella pinea TaxID=933095 RepID=A0AAI8VTU8_9PEZI|nr:Uu.00g066120.m01.CDS01 [Anthostomella pinea]